MTRDSRRTRIEQAFREFDGSAADDQEVRAFLDHDDETVRTVALQTLAGYAGNPVSVERLLPSVVARATDPEPRVREAARAVMRRLAETCAENDESIPRLETLLAHEADDVRRDALHGAKMAGERHPGVLSDHLSTVTDLLSDPDGEIRREAALVVGIVAKDRPDEVADVAPELVDRLENDDVLVKNAVVEALATLSADRPRAAVDAIPALRREFDAGVVDAEPAVETVGNVVAVAPESVRPLTADLVDVATESVDGVQQNGGGTLADAARQNERRLSHGAARAEALSALESIAEHDPDAVAPRVQAMTPLLASPVPGVRERTLALIRTLGIERPRTMETTVPALIEHAGEAPDPAERTRARKVLIAFGEAAPSAFARRLERHVDLVVDLLSHDETEVRGSAAGLLTYVAERDPAAVSAATETLLERLDDDPVVRANAALALGLCGSDGARAALAALDPDEEFVEDAVERALTRLD